MLKLKFRYLGHLLQRSDSLEKTLMLRKIEGKRRKERQRMRWLAGITVSIDMSMSKLQVFLMDRKAWHAACIHGVAKSWTWLSDWAEISSHRRFLDFILIGAKTIFSCYSMMGYLRIISYSGCANVFLTSSGKHAKSFHWAQFVMQRLIPNVKGELLQHVLSNVVPFQSEDLTHLQTRLKLAFQRSF